MKVTIFGTLVNKTTYLFSSIRDSNNSRGCAKILEILDGTGWGVNFGVDFGRFFTSPSVGVVWIFSGTAVLYERGSCKEASQAYVMASLQCKGKLHSCQGKGLQPFLKNTAQLTKLHIQ